MVLPHDDELQDALVDYLFQSPDYRAHAQECYSALEERFPQLSPEEVNERYRSSVSKWANRVQFARLHLVHGGYIHAAKVGPSLAHGVWILTPLGVARAKLYNE